MDYQRKYARALSYIFDTALNIEHYAKILECQLGYTDEELINELYMACGLDDEEVERVMKCVKEWQ